MKQDINLFLEKYIYNANKNTYICYLKTFHKLYGFISRLFIQIYAQNIATIQSLKSLSR